MQTKLEMTPEQAAKLIEMYEAGELRDIGVSRVYATPTSRDESAEPAEAGSGEEVTVSLRLLADQHRALLGSYSDAELKQLRLGAYHPLVGVVQKVTADGAVVRYPDARSGVDIHISKEGIKIESVVDLLTGSSRLRVGQRVRFHITNILTESRIGYLGEIVGTVDDKK